MANEDNIFHSNITRIHVEKNNNLYELLHINPAKPVLDRQRKAEICNFIPNLEKIYVPKNKSSKLKVKTVRDIRKEFEKDTCDLTSNVEKQQNTLLKKISNGWANNEKTLSYATDMFKVDKPITRQSWQMLVNINPNKCRYSTQFVLWNGKPIQVNGSRGGNVKFLHKFNSTEKHISETKPIILKNNNVTKRKGLLQKSLSIKFKPGPLKKKQYLDYSHQKYHVGYTELVNLPKPGLDIQPIYGAALETNMSNFVNSLRDESGLISKKWAELAVSVLGKLKKSNPVQSNLETITFDLNFKSQQNRILMRRDGIYSPKDERLQCTNVPYDPAESDNEIKLVMTQLIDSVEISLLQDSYFADMEEPREIIPEDSINSSCITKEKLKKKYSELDRLDVTVINLPESRNNVSEICGKSYCSLGCVCASLEGTYMLRRHCGLIDCMFECKCNFLKNKNPDNSDDEIISGLHKFDTVINNRLAKEEQKFHQTVIMTGEKSILLKSNKRIVKTSTKYTDYYNKMSSRRDANFKKELRIIETKLDLKNVEPWCMVHNLYKCYCKGRFIEPPTVPCSQRMSIEPCALKTPSIGAKVPNVSLDDKSFIKSRPQKTSDCEILSDDNDEYCNSSSRTTPYTKRKYSDLYYKKINIKVQEMEANDFSLREKISKITGIEIAPKIPSKPLVAKTRPNETGGQLENGNNKTSIFRGPILTEKIVDWLEKSYKTYKENKEYKSLLLDPPKTGKLSLYPWNFLLTRYREQHNLFLVSLQPPYRLFMAVHSRHPMFENCMNINDIRFADLHKYPVTVKNLLTNVTDVSEHFCILCGLGHCWELVGSVVKTKKQILTLEENESSEDTKHEKSPSLEESETCNSSNCATDNQCNLPEISEPYKSKWFFMTVENDFNEIQFYNKGFFVKYQSILNAINVARQSGKTVRLSSQTCAIKSNSPQFGMYAIPNANECCVFIGPYRVNESLGIETIKTDITKQKRTRGFWITTSKMDNWKVIDNPFAFIPKTDKPITVPIENYSIGDSTSFSESKSSVVEKPSLKTSAPSKIIKPITIRKSNGFYHLSPSDSLKILPINNKISIAPLKKGNEGNPSTKNTESSSKTGDDNTTVLNTDNNEQPRKLERGMLILKPEEINKKLFENKINISNVEPEIETEMDMDIESFLNTSKINRESGEVFLISDDEENDNETFTHVWIESELIRNLGWIPGRKNLKGHISFMLPGLLYSDFFTKDEAFTKINEALSRLIVIPKSIEASWKVVEKKEDLKSKKRLDIKSIKKSTILRRSNPLNKIQGKTKFYINRRKDEDRVMSEDLGESSKQRKTKTIVLLNEAIAKREDNMIRVVATSESTDTETDQELMQ